MSTVRLTINGRTIDAEEGTTVLAAAHKAGIEIPTLCHHPKLEPFGGCRLCIVEVEHRGRTRTVVSCAYPVQEGLVVTTSTPKIERMRKLIVELLWPAYTTAPAKQIGVQGSRFSTGLPDCSLCGLCVRYCREVTHKNAIYFEGRGTERHVAFTPGMAQECDSCRECFDLCSSGWIVHRYASQTAQDWEDRPFFMGVTGS